MNRTLARLPSFKRSAITLVAIAVTAATPAAIAAASSDAASPASSQRPSSNNRGRNAPDYPVPYAPPSDEEVMAVLDRVRSYLEQESPMTLERRSGSFRIVSYEWGVTYSGMLRVAEVTGDARYRRYVEERMRYIAEQATAARDRADKGEQRADARTITLPSEQGGGQPRRFTSYAMRAVVAPRSLDDSGSMCAAMIKSIRAGLDADLRPWVDNYIDYISNRQFRLPDGTLARNRPLPNSLWLDDLYMSVPALAQMGKLTGETRYYDDAVKQILQFAERMFIPEKGLYMHGWVQGMEPHPVFHWARANGWAIMAATELLDVLPEDHPQRARILELYRAHLRGLAACQGGDGLWHQLLDRNDSYLETSASAIFVYCAAHGINRGWIDPLAYGPMATLGWNAVAQRVNDRGQVEGTCVGTGMGFDPTFYYYRPTSVLAAHGYGPVLLAGAELIALHRGKGSAANVHDGAIQFGESLSRF